MEYFLRIVVAADIVFNSGICMFSFIAMAWTSSTLSFFFFYFPFFPFFSSFISFSTYNIGVFFIFHYRCVALVRWFSERVKKVCNGKRHKKKFGQSDEKDDNIDAKH